MRFLIDANLPRAVIAVVQNLGHRAEFARDIGLASATDEQIASHALQYRAALLTRDLDFADIRQYPREGDPARQVEDGELRDGRNQQYSKAPRIGERLVSSRPTCLGSQHRSGTGLARQ